MTIKIDVETKFKPYRNGALTKKLTIFLDRYVRCGVFGAKAKKRHVNTTRKAYISVGQLALQNEYGTDTYTLKEDRRIKHPQRDEWIVLKKGTSIKIPARPAFRNVVDNQQYVNEIFARITPIVKSLFTAGESKGTSAIKSWKKMGIVMEDVVKKSYSDLNSPKNSSLTQWFKDKDDPLSDTNQVYNAITSKVISEERSIKGAFKQKVNARTKSILNQLRKGK